MKNLIKSFITGLLILIANVSIGAWAWYSITGLLNAINDHTGWLAIIDFIVLLVVIAAVAFYVICQGALARYLIDIENKCKEKCNV